MLRNVWFPRPLLVSGALTASSLGPTLIIPVGWLAFFFSVTVVGMARGVILLVVGRLILGVLLSFFSGKPLVTSDLDVTPFLAVEA